MENKQSEEILNNPSDEENDLDSTCGISDEELTYRFREAVRIENEIKRIKGFPIAKYDFEKNAQYIEYPDGRIIYAEKDQI